MLPFFWYMLKVIICSGILFGYYWLFLRNKIFHQYNRFYLLAAIVMSLSLPLFKIDFWQPDTPKNQAIRVLQAVSAGDEYMTSIITAKESHWSLEQLYPVVYIFGCLIFLFAMLRTLYLIRTLLKNYPVQQVEQVAFINTQDDSTPFSFLKYIFWNSSIDIDTNTGRQIFRHEVAHIQEKHTHDKLFVNIILIFCWCNPFFWLYRKELNMIHEFIADKKAVEDSDTSAFAAMILQAAYPKHRFELTNNFFYSPIKRRLMMLTKKRSPRVNYVARIMVLPLTILVFAAFSLKTKPETVFKKIQGFALIPGSSDNPKPVNTYVTDTIPEKTFRRAITSINKPIYFLDGEEIDSAAVAKLNPNELASIYVLKGEKAFEKYGPKAINGAIEISRKDIQKGLNARPDIVYEVPLQNITPDNDSAWINLRELPIKEEQKNQQTAKLLESKLAEATDIKISEQGKKLYERQLTELKEKLITEEIKLAKIDYEKKQQAYLNAVKDLQKSAAAKKMQEKQLLELKRKLNAGLLNKVKLNYTENLKANLALQQKKSLGLMQKQKINTELLDLAKLKYAEARKINSGVDKLALQQKELQTVEGYLIFTKTEINPRFTGGHEAWIKFLRANLKVNVPVDNGAKAGKYTVVLRFIVNADGTLSDITCETDPGFGICAEAIRFIKTTPKWQPAFQNGKKVNAYMKQPITFVVEE